MTRTITVELTEAQYNAVLRALANMETGHLDNHEYPQADACRNAHTKIIVAWNLRGRRA